MTLSRWYGARQLSCLLCLLFLWGDLHKPDQSRVNIPRPTVPSLPDRELFPDPSLLSLKWLIPLSPLRFQSSIPSQPTDYRDREYFYREYLAPLDKSIRRDYEEQWGYHDSQIPFAMFSWNYEHLSLASLDHYGQAPYEVDVRKAFAERVLRARLDKMIHRYFSHPQRAITLKRVNDVYRQVGERLRDYPVTISDGPMKGEIRAGYDVASDSSKIEYRSERFDFGIYHPHLLASLMGTKPKVEAIHLRISANIGSHLPSTSFAYQVNGRFLEASLGKALSAGLNAQLVALRWVREDLNTTQYQFRLDYRF